MSREDLHCAVCGVKMAVADAELAVRTDDGPVHRECFEGPVAPPDLPDDVLIDADEEEQARHDHGDPPLPPEVIRELPDGRVLDDPDRGRSML